MNCQSKFKPTIVSALFSLPLFCSSHSLYWKITGKQKKRIRVTRGSKSLSKSPTVLIIRLIPCILAVVVGLRVVRPVVPVVDELQLSVVHLDAHNSVVELPESKLISLQIQIQLILAIKNECYEKLCRGK